MIPAGAGLQRRMTRTQCAAVWTWKKRKKIRKKIDLIILVVQ
jgi:hypothetical protein